MDSKGSRLFWTDPSGAFLAYKAWAIGAGGEASNEILEKEYNDNLSLDDSIKLTLKCMVKIFEGKAEAQKIRLVVIPSKTKKFRYLSSEEIGQYLKAIK